jgi:hypothetical protein
MKNIICGNVKFEQRSADSILVRSVVTPQLFVVVPMRILETWGLRKLREDALVPARGKK